MIYRASGNEVIRRTVDPGNLWNKEAYLYCPYQTMKRKEFDKDLPVNTNVDSTQFPSGQDDSGQIIGVRHLVTQYQDIPDYKWDYNYLESHVYSVPFEDALYTTGKRHSIIGVSNLQGGVLNISQEQIDQDETDYWYLYEYYDKYGGTTSANDTLSDSTSSNERYHTGNYFDAINLFFICNETDAPLVGPSFSPTQLFPLKDFVEFIKHNPELRKIYKLGDDDHNTQTSTCITNRNLNTYYGIRGNIKRNVDVISHFNVGKKNNNTEYRTIQDFQKFGLRADYYGNDMLKWYTPWNMSMYLSDIARAAAPIWDSPYGVNGLNQSELTTNILYDDLQEVRDILMYPVAAYINWFFRRDNNNTNHRYYLYTLKLFVPKGARTWSRPAI